MTPKRKKFAKIFNFLRFSVPIDLGVFKNFQKNDKKNLKPTISPQLRVPEDRTSARWKGLVLGFHFGSFRSSLCRRAPIL